VLRKVTPTQPSDKKTRKVVNLFLNSSLLRLNLLGSRNTKDIFRKQTANGGQIINPEITKQNTRANTGAREFFRAVRSV
jgi:hypothetical protein